MEYSSKDFHPHGIKGAYSEGEKQGYMLGYKKGSKETAEKILNKVNEFFRPFDKKSPIFLDLLLTKLENIVKQFGVEIKE